MADKRIDQLPTANSITDGDYMLIENSGVAKKVLGSTVKTATNRSTVPDTTEGEAADVIAAICAKIIQEAGYATYSNARLWTNHTNGFSYYAFLNRYNSGNRLRISGVFYDFQNGAYLFVDTYNEDTQAHTLRMTARMPWA